MGVDGGKFFAVRAVFDMQMFAAFQGAEIIPQLEVTVTSKLETAEANANKIDVLTFVDHISADFGILFSPSLRENVMKIARLH